MTEPPSRDLTVVPLYQNVHPLHRRLGELQSGGSYNSHNRVNYIYHCVGYERRET